MTSSDTICCHIYYQLKTQKSPYLQKAILGYVALSQHRLVTSAEQIERQIEAALEGENPLYIHWYSIDWKHSIAQKLISRKVDTKAIINHRTGPAAYFTRAQAHPVVGTESATHLTIVPHVHSLFNSHHSKYLINGDQIQIMSWDIGWHDTEANASIIIKNDKLAKKMLNLFEKQKKRCQGLLDEMHDTFVETDDNNKNILILSKNESTDPLKRMQYRSPFHSAYLQVIQNAQTNIYICTPNINDHKILEALSLAASRGVKVVILIGKHANDSRERKPFMGGTNLSSLESLFQKTDPCYHENIEVRWNYYENVFGDDLNRRKIHAKFAIFDEEIVMAGTSPLDKQSVYFSEELDVIIQNDEIAKQYMSAFQDFSNENRTDDKKCFNGVTKRDEFINYHVERLESFKVAIKRNIQKSVKNDNEFNSLWTTIEQAKSRRAVFKGIHDGMESAKKNNNSPLESVLRSTLEDFFSMTEKHQYIEAETVHFNLSPTYPLSWSIGLGVLCGAGLLISFFLMNHYEISVTNNSYDHWIEEVFNIHVDASRNRIAPTTPVTLVALPILFGVGIGLYRSWVKEKKINPAPL